MKFGKCLSLVHGPKHIKHSHEKIKLVTRIEKKKN